MKVIVQDRETANINGEDSRQLREAVFDSLLSMRVLFTTQKGTSDTP